ncbi:MAG: ABC transporter substrate-binding protein, partial [Anaerolineae bacterium]
DEVALGRGGERHPLEKVLTECKRYYGDIWVDLEEGKDVDGRQFVDALLDTEPNRLGEAFREALFRHTLGHPLFTVELLRDMQERGDLVQDEESRWIEGPALDWKALPARVEGVIEERIGRLEEELRKTLTVASVEGEDFAAQVVARVREADERSLVRQLSRELDKKHRLVGERGSQQVGRHRLYLYRFRHTLFQQHLYNGLGEIEREMLHGEIAAVLEELYKRRTDEIAVQLAHHWLRAGEDEKAAGYMLTAGDQARALYAHTEAEQFYQAAVRILRQQGQDELAARTLMKLGLVYTAAFEPEKARRAYDEAFTLWEPLRERRELLISPLPPAVLRFAVGEPVSLDPGKTYDTDSSFFQVQLFEGLVEVDLDQNVLPAIAARWEVADGGTRYIFYLREKARWSDGAPVMADHFEYAWKRNLDPATASPAAHLLYDIQNARAFREGKIDDPELVGVKALTERTLEVRLESPTAYLPHLLAHPIAYPLPRWVIEAHQEAWTVPGNIVTNGAYELVEWQRGERLILRRNPYYGSRFPGNAERIECLVFTDFGLALQAYAAHAIDVVDMTAADAGVMAQARAAHGEELVFTSLLSTNYLIFRADRPPFDDVRIRRAFVHAVDREALTRQLSRGEYLPATGGFVPPGMPGHSPGIGLAYDPEAARRLLAEAGYPGGQGFPIVTWLHTHGLSDESFIPFLQGAWRRNLDVAVEATTLAWEPFLTRLDSAPPHLTLGGWIADYPDPDNFLRVVFHSTEGMNEPYWHNVRFDALVEEAAQVTDQARRMELYHEADRTLVAEEAVIMPLSYGRTPVLMKPWVTHFPRVFSYSRHLKDIVVERGEH